MSRATVHSGGMLSPDPPALRAPSRGRRTQQCAVRSYGASSGSPFSGSQHATFSISRRSTPAGAVQAIPAVTGTWAHRAAGAGYTRSTPGRCLHGWHTAPVATAAFSHKLAIGPARKGPAQLQLQITASETVLKGSGATAGAAASPSRNILTTAHRRNGPLSAGAGFQLSYGSSCFPYQQFCPSVHPEHHYRHDHHYQQHLDFHHRRPQSQRPGFSGSLHHSATRAQRLANARFRLHAAKSSGAAASGSGLSNTLQEGSLVEYEKNDRDVLAVLVAPDGKKNWFAADQTGRRQSITPKQVQMVLPGSGYTEADVAAFAAAAEATDMTLLEIAWEIAAESGEPLQLRELAILLYDDTAPKSLYVTHRMLQRDTLYFKLVSRSGAARWYVPRSADDVATLRRQQEVAAAARQAEEAWRTAVAAARGAKTQNRVPSAAEWQAGPFADRIAALKAIALSTPRTDDVTTQLALSSLQLAGTGSRVDPDAAAQLLVEIGAFRRHEPLQLLRRGLALQPPSDQEREALALLASPPPDPDAESREDLTHLPVFTIDDASTTEVDDGLSLERLPGGVGFRIWIHVADPTRWIRPGSNLDVAGRERIRTLYLPWGSVPMFPRQLAEGPFSLREGQVCDAMSVSVVLGKDGSLGRSRVVPSRVRVSHKLTYDQADAVLAAATAAAATGSAAVEAPGSEDAAMPTKDASEILDHAALADLVELQKVALSRRAYREARGCIEIQLPEAKIHVPYSHLDRARPSVSITRISQWESVSRGLVAEMMILAGEAIGAIGTEAALPLPYRGQVDPPDLPPAHVLATLPEGPCRGFALKRCMTRSSVAPEPQRHASLALEAYVQFTSPIRRYTDMLAHHNLKAWLRGEPLPFSGPDIASLMAAAGETARELGTAERESESYWIAEYLQLNWGAEYPAIVLGWQREDLHLAAFLLEREGLEVVVRVPHGTAFSPGDYCVLLPTEVNPATGFYRFCIAGWTSGSVTEPEEEDEELDEEEEEEGTKKVVAVGAES